MTLFAVVQLPPSPSEEGLDVLLITIADSAFKKESPDSAHVLRGNLLGLGTEKVVADRIQHRFHLLEYYTRSQKHVVRNTWAGELFDQVDAADNFAACC